MALALCASCKQKVEEGAVKCANCGAQLDRPGAFTEVMGWVTVSISTIPFALSLVTFKERDFIPLIVGCVVLAAGIVMLVSGKVRSRMSPPTVIPDTSGMNPPPLPLPPGTNRP